MNDFNIHLHEISEIKDRQQELDYAESHGFIKQQAMTEAEKWDYYYAIVATENDSYLRSRYE